ncbi:helix-turn-helix domain-containing protein [Paenibacillus bouchesdurhonensis]|uniref:helix-turn-helix domain-containing protein n=1 Tax=Paenibacillus bouchesdurhonensis TaxID=1870990 RepID=UPI000DA602F9|nr:helix-turn-helix domain-containing protein [Paenibacillus bouchesdurhonensis]
MSDLNQLNKGILRLEEAKKNFTIARHIPSEHLRFLIRHYWIVEWNLNGGLTHRQEVLQHPGVNIIFQQGHSHIHGIESKKSTYLLQGEGQIIGVLFRPGAFHCYGGLPMTDFIDRTASISDIFPFDASWAENEIFSQGGMDQKLACLEVLLTRNLPEPDPNVDLLNKMIDQIVEDRRITRVDDLVREYNMSSRTLQRMFKQYIGVSPKWVINRYRMHEACESIEKGADITELSLELGYFDQAHFSKDFKAVIGKSPRAYAKLSRKS